MINAITVIWSGRGLNTGTSNFALDIHLLGLLSSTLFVHLVFLLPLGYVPEYSSCQNWFLDK